MEDKFLQDILKTGLFDIGDNDERLKWLQESIADLAKKFEKDKSLLQKFTLVALDPNISDSEPVMIETEAIITIYWKALRGKYTEMPRNIIRGVILNALNNIGTTDAIAARIIYLTAMNFYPYAKLNAEKKIIEEMLKALGVKAEANAVEEWSLIDEEPSLKLGVLKVTGLQYNSITVNTEDLKNKLTASVTPGYSQHQNQTGFGQHFGSNASIAIAEIFTQLNNELSKSLSTTLIEGSLNKFFSEFKRSLDTNLKSSFSSLTAVERRSKLLWWKETLYSASQKTSYRGLDRALLPILMSFDLNSQVPDITPISVDYLLRDTLFLLIEKQDSQIKFSEYLSQISSVSLKSLLRPYFSNLTDREGRISITDFIALLINERIELKDLKARTGIDESEEITLTDLSVVVLHDLLTQRLISK